MQKLFNVGDEPVPGYRLLDEIEGTAFYKLWRVRTPDGCDRSWKIIDLVVGNAAIETRTLGLLVRLRHPHLNTLTNFWNLDDGKTLIIESDLPSQSVRELAKTRQRDGQTGVSREELTPYFEQAAEGLDFLNKPQHDYNGRQVAIYHRALRPDCLLLFDEDGRRICKVSDFGLSKPVTDEVAQHSQGLLHYDYDPPEFFEGQTTPTSDQYSLAVNYYELRTGQMPFRGTMLEQLQARLNDRPDLSYLNEPERGLVRKALSRDPSRRYESCLDFVLAVKECRPGESKSVDQQAQGLPSRSEGVEALATGNVSAPRPTSTGSANRGWRSVTAFEGTAKAPAAPSRMAESQVAQFAKELPGAMGTRAIAGTLSPATDTSVTLATSAVDTIPARVPKPRIKTKTAPPADLRSIREHIGSGTMGLSDAYPGQRRVPIVWVVITLALTALSSIWLTSNFGM